MTRLASLFLTLLFFTGSVEAQQARTVFVGNQGSPASVTAIDPATGSETQLLGGQLGGYLQGMALINGHLYVTGNGTRIDVLDAETQQRVAQITDAAFPTARYIAQVSETRAYVTTQTYNAEATTTDVVVIDLEGNTVVGRIALPVTSQDGLVFGNPEGLAVVGSRAYVSQAAFGQGSEIAVIDTQTDELVTIIETNCTARYPVADDDGDVIVPCQGDNEVVVIDTETNTVAQRVSTSEGVSLGSAFAQGATVATVDGTETVYILAGAAGVATFDPDAYAFGPVIPIPEADTRSVSSLAVDVGRGHLTLGRPDPDNPYGASGTATVHALATGAVEATYEAGVFPTFILVDAAAGTSTEPPAVVAFEVSVPHPNPAVGAARLTVTLEAPAEVYVSVVDALGRTIRSLVPSALPAGAQEVALDVSGLPAGVYVVRLATERGTASRRLTVAR